MSNEDLEKKIEDANSRWENTVSVPEEVDWHGFYAYGDAPAAIGGGFGSFIWFSQRSEMLDFIKHVLPYSPPGRFYNSNGKWRIYDISADGQSAIIFYRGYINRMLNRRN